MTDDDGREALAAIIEQADDRWQHGVGSSGTTWQDYLAAAIIDAGWINWKRDQGFAE